MQKKIGIITFHNSVNYGAVMQTYGLQQYLKSKGYNVEIIDYVNDKINAELNYEIPFTFTSPKSVLKYIAKRVHRYRKAKVFKVFNERHLSLSVEKNIRRNEISKLSASYDVVITGSDQVWNLNLTGDDSVYFLDFPNNKTKKIAYAVSVGDVSKIDLKNVMSEIKSFAAISVREKSFLDCIKCEYGIQASICSDPTILAGKNIFESISKGRLSDKKYVFCFLMESKPGIIEIAHKLARENNWEIIDNKSSLKFFLHSKPEDFLSWIKNAEFVLTDSFHGTVFSILFEKQFLSDKYDGNRKTKSRVKDLLETIGLIDRFQKISMENIANINEIIYTSIDYSNAAIELEKFSDSSREWLINAIEGTDE